jgi:hypothetical protein
MYAVNSSADIIPFPRKPTPNRLLIAEFVAFLRADAMTADCADEMAVALGEIDATGHASSDAYAFREAIMWILRQPRATAEKLDAIQRLAALDKAEHMSMKHFTGWM